MTIHYLDQAAQNALSDLLSASLTPDFDGKAIGFPTKTIKGKKYIYVATKVGNVPMQRYPGPDNEETRELVNKEKALWQSTAASRIHRARLVNMV